MDKKQKILSIILALSICLNCGLGLHVYDLHANIMDDTYEEGVDFGYSTGYSQGRSDARDSSYDQGYEDGYTDGLYQNSSSTEYYSDDTYNSSNDDYSDDDYSDDYDYTTVYVTDTGSKYHQWGCQYLHSSCIEISLSDAQSQGYDACSRCW